MPGPRPARSVTSMNRGTGADAPPLDLLVQAADVLAWPMWLLGPDAELLWSNRAAAALLRGPGVLALHDGRVQAPGRPPGELPALLGRAQQQVAPALLHWPEAGVTLSAQALAPPPEPRWMLLLSGGAAPAGVAADVRAWAASHGLSAAETRVLLRLAEGDTPREAAGVLGVAPATVRSQLRAIGRKTGLGGASALQQALLRLPPLRSPATPAPPAPAAPH